MSLALWGPTRPSTPDLEIPFTETPPPILTQPIPIPIVTASDTESMTATAGSRPREIEMSSVRRVERLHLNEEPGVAIPEEANKVFSPLYDFTLDLINTLLSVF